MSVLFWAWPFKARDHAGVLFDQCEVETFGLVVRYLNSIQASTYVDSFLLLPVDSVAVSVARSTDALQLQCNKQNRSVQNAELLASIGPAM